MNMRNLVLPAVLIAAWAVVGETTLAQLTLTVDRQSGSASVTNNTGGTLSFDAYTTESAFGMLDSTSWASTNLNTSDPNNWQVVGNVNDNRVGELYTLIDEAVTVPDGGSTSVGDLFRTDATTAQTAQGFGVDVEDLTFSYNEVDPNTGEITTVVGNVEYVGNKQFNDLVIQVDTSTGNVVLTNESPFTVTFDAYGIESDLGVLSPGWNGLRDTETGWIGGAGGSDSPNQLSEFFPDPNQGAGLAITPGATFDLGTAFNIAFNPDLDPNDAITEAALLSDIQFSYILDGDSFGSSGGVELVSGSPGIPGDFNLDGKVDGLDFLAWQRGESSSPLSQSDLSDWQANYGTPVVANGAVVPEPTSLMLCFGALCYPLLRRCGD